MTGTRIQEVFKGFGKFARLAEIGVASASGIRAHVLATHQQFGQQTGGTYDDITRVVVPLVTNMRPVEQAIDRVLSQAKVAADAYLRTIGNEMNQPATASSAAILNALKLNMVATSQTIAPSGKVWNYFQQTYGVIDLPTSNTPSLPDSIVTTSIV